MSNAEATAAIVAVEEEFTTLYRALRAGMRGRAELVSPAMKPACFAVLVTIARDGPVSSRRLAELLFMEKAAVSRHVAELCDLGLVESHIDPADRRVRLLQVTGEAQERLNAPAFRATAPLRSRLADWSPEELRQLTALLRRLNDAIP